MKKALITFTIFALGCLGFATPASAVSQLSEFAAVETNILNECGSKEGGEGITCILDLVVDILTIGIGILGVIGISVVGIQYLTAGGNEEQTRKAKRRMFEIILGLAVYAVFYAFVQFLTPLSSSGGGGSGSGSGSGSETTTPTENTRGGGTTTTHESSSGEEHGGRGGKY